MAGALPLMRLLFSAASGRGLIGAGWLAAACVSMNLFSAASGRGLIEATGGHGMFQRSGSVFRGIGPRPH